MDKLKMLVDGISRQYFALIKPHANTTKFVRIFPAKPKCALERIANIPKVTVANFTNFHIHEVPKQEGTKKNAKVQKCNISESNVSPVCNSCLVTFCRLGPFFCFLTFQVFFFF